MSNCVQYIIVQRNPGRVEIRGGRRAQYVAAYAKQQHHRLVHALLQFAQQARTQLTDKKLHRFSGRVRPTDAGASSSESAVAEKLWRKTTRPMCTHTPARFYKQCIKIDNYNSTKTNCNVRTSVRQYPLRSLTASLSVFVYVCVCERDLERTFN